MEDLRVLRGPILQSLRLVYFILQSLSCLITKIVQLQMTDNPKTQSKGTLFSLMRLRLECKVQPTNVDFQPLYSSSTSTGSIVPVFNDDRCHFTPAFMLPSQKKARAKGSQAGKLLFEQRVRQTIGSQESLLPSGVSPKIEGPTPPSHYCQICREHFKDYEQHSEQKAHLLRWKHNEFNEDIRHLCLKVKQIKSEVPSICKRKMIKKKEKDGSNGYAIKDSPKTTVDNYPKRKMSSCDQDGSLNQTLIEESFNI